MRFFEIARIGSSDFGDEDTLRSPVYTVDKKPLPGGSKFTYAVGRPQSEAIEIMIFDGDTLAAEMDLDYTQDDLKTWQVDSVVTAPSYRGQGLGKALYGIALSQLKLTLEAGQTQTRHGQAMWLMLNSIPGVEVLGYDMVPAEQYRARSGDKIVSQDNNYVRYTFPVKPGATSMRSGRKGTGIYNSATTSMIAKWAGS